MRPEKLSYDDCGNETIFRIIIEKTDADETDCDKSANALKPNKLPLPRDLNPNQSTVKVYSYCKIVDKTDKPVESIINKTESNKSDKSKQKCTVIDCKSESQLTDNSKPLKGKDSSDANIKDSSSQLKNCHKNLSDNKSTKPLDKKVSCKSTCKTKYLQEKCEKYLQRKLSESQSQLQDTTTCSTSQDNNNKASTVHEERRSRCLNKHCLIKEVQKYLHQEEAKDGSTKKASVLQNYINKKRAELKKECDEYLEKKKCEKRDKANTSDKSCRTTCKGPCKKPPIEEECKNKIEETKPCPQSSSVSSCPKRKQSFREFCQELKEKNKCKDINRNKYLEALCDKKLQEEKPKIQDNFHCNSSVESVSTHKIQDHSKSDSSFKSVCRRKTTKNASVTNLSIQSSEKPEKSNSLSSICTQKKSLCKDICSIFSDTELKTKCEEYLKRKYPKDQRSSSEAKECEQLKKCFKSDKQEIPASEESHSKKKKCTDICRKSSTCPPQKKTLKDIHKQTKKKCENDCKVTDICKQNENSNTDCNKIPEDNNCDNDIRAKCTELQKLKSQLRCSKLTKQENKDKTRSTYTSPSGPQLESAGKDTPDCISDKTSTTVLQNISAKSAVKRSLPLYLCLHTCDSRQTSIIETDYPKAPLLKSGLHPSKSPNISLPNLQYLDHAEDIQWNRYCPTSSDIDKDKRENSAWNKYFSSSFDSNKPTSEHKIPPVPLVSKLPNKMDSSQTNKICITNPQAIKQPIESGIISSEEQTPLKLDGNNTKLENEIIYTDYDQLSNTRPFAEIGQPKSILDAHRKTMSTIKFAMQDMVSKAYKTTSEAADAAASLIHDESTKHLEKLKKYQNRQGISEVKSKECSNMNETNGMQQFDNSICNKSKFGDGQLKVLDELVSSINSTVSFVNVCSGWDGFKISNFNDDSSKYDTPDPKLNQTMTSSIENVLSTSTPTNSVLTSIKTKILSIFTGVEKEVKRDDVSPSSTEASGSSISTDSTIDTEEELINKSSE